MSRTVGTAAASALALAAAASTAAAGPHSEVASALDDEDPFDLHIVLDYEYQLRRSTIAREMVGDLPADVGDPVPSAPELEFTSSRHLLVPRAALAFYRDLALTFALPIVVVDARRIELGADVDRDSATTIRDGLLPRDGFDADDPTTNFPGDDPLIFRGIDRAGLDQLHLGIVWAAMNQRRDPTKPTWKLGAELRYAVGKRMRFDATNPEGETGVSPRVHEVRLYTSMAKRVGWAEPYFEAWWIAPVGLAAGSLFEDPGFGATSTAKSQQAGTRFGFEAIAVDLGEDAQRVSLDLSARVVAHFEGRGYSELWEVFALAGDTETGGPLILDEDPVMSGLQAISHPGITNIENHLELGGRAALRVDLGPLVHLAAFAELSRETPHVISFTDAGVDRPRCAAGQSEGPDCETAANDVVDPGTIEENPLHVPIIDLVGHRYIAEGALNVHLGVQARVLF